MKSKEGKNHSPVVQPKNEVWWEQTCQNKGEPSSKAKYYKFSDSEKYREGKFEIVMYY